MYNILEDKLFQEKYKRVENALHFRKTDRIPYVDWAQNAEVIEYYSYKSGKRNYWNMEQACLFAKNALDMNMEHTPSYTPDTFFPTPQDLCGIFDYENAAKNMKVLKVSENTWTTEDSAGYIWEYDYWNRWIIKHPFDDYNGAIKMLKKKTEEVQYFSNNIDWPSYASAYQQGLVDNIEKSSTPCFYLTPFGGVGFDILYLIIGWEFLSEMLYSDDIRLVKEYVNSCVDLTTQWVEKAVDKRFSPMALVYSDIAYNIGLMISPVMLEEILGEGLNRLTEVYHKHGIKVIYHSEGNIQKFLPVLIKNGIDGINPLEPYTGMEIVETRRKYPDLVLYGGVDNGERLLPHGTPAEVTEYVKHVIKEIGNDSGLLLASSGQIHPACKLENVIAMIDAIRNTKVE